MDRKEFWSWVVFGLAVMVILWLGVFQPAHAHDLLANGDPVPPYIKANCCGASDFHHLTKEQIHLQPDGSWVVDGYNKVIPKGTETPSPDGEVYIFYRTFADGTQTNVYCFFYPFGGL